MLNRLEAGEEAGPGLGEKGCAPGLDGCTLCTWLEDDARTDEGRALEAAPEAKGELNDDSSDEKKEEDRGLEGCALEAGAPEEGEDALGLETEEGPEEGASPEDGEDGNPEEGEDDLGLDAGNGTDDAWGAEEGEEGNPEEDDGRGLEGDEGAVDEDDGGNWAEDDERGLDGEKGDAGLDEEVDDRGLDGEAAGEARPDEADDERGLDDEGGEADEAWEEAEDGRLEAEEALDEDRRLEGLPK